MENIDSQINEIYTLQNNRSLALKYNDSGHQKYMQVNFDDAITDFTEAIKLDPSLSVAYYNRGTVVYRLGDYYRALKDLEKAVALEPENIEFLKGFRDCKKLCEGKYS